MSLRIEGAVEAPRELTFEEMRRLPGQIEDASVVVAGRSGGAVTLRAVLRTVRLDSRADHLTVEADDGVFAASVPLDAIADAVLVYRTGESPLPRDKGGPVRLLIPDAARCGRAEVDTCANVKYVATLRLDIGRGRDTRPTTRDEHAAVHAETPKTKH